MITLTDDLHEEMIRVNPLFIVAYRKAEDLTEVFLANFDARETPIYVRETVAQIDELVGRPWGS